MPGKLVALHFCVSLNLWFNKYHVQDCSLFCLPQTHPPSLVPGLDCAQEWPGKHSVIAAGANYWNRVKRSEQEEAKKKKKRGRMINWRKFKALPFLFLLGRGRMIDRRRMRANMRFQWDYVALCARCWYSVCRSCSLVLSRLHCTVYQDVDASGGVAIWNGTEKD